jgi:hypothetical protein
MTVSEIQVRVSPTGEVDARTDDGAYGPSGTVRVDGIDGDLIRVFERWLRDRTRPWRLQEIAAFGGLLHRSLFTQDQWAWIETILATRDRADRVRLQLALPGSGLTFLAAIPWEYLRVPDRAGQEGYFLATRRGLMLTRHIPMERGQPALVQQESARLLVLVARPDGLGEVVAEPVLETLRAIAEVLPLELRVLDQPTRGSLEREIEEFRPDIVHFMGHGDYDEDAEQGRLAFVREDDGRADWVGDAVLADLLGAAGDLPRLLVLHSCSGARVDDRARFAGIAPRLIRQGTQCVVAMQYAVTNGTATAFSTGLYDGLGRGLPVDEAVQAGRQRLFSRFDADPSLLGVPVVYLRNRQPVLLAATDTTPDVGGRR